MRRWLIPPLLVLTSGAFAQAPALRPNRTPPAASEDQELEELLRQQRQLNERIDRLKQRRSAAVPAPAATSPSKKQELRPGWVVTVYPKPTKGQTPAPLGRFIAKPGGFRFGDLRNTLPFQGWASFRASALYNVKAGGRGAYTFAVALSSEERKSYFYRISCEVGLHVADQDPIVQANSKVAVQTQGDFQRTFVGAANLEEGAHPIDLSVVCSFTNGTQGQTADDFFDGPLGVRNVFDTIQVAVTVFGPNDMQARTPQVDELIHNVTGGNP